jgi:hypothetical protein
MSIPIGPIHTAPINAIPLAGRGSPPGARRAAFRAELDRALEGVDLGAWDQVIVDWLSGWDVATVTAVCSLLLRAREAGRHDARVEGYDQGLELFAEGLARIEAALVPPLEPDEAAG